tara:strand:- start:54138 stop:54800 length:663 start_codon:yes stop_codon:yes gene_type:complete
MTSCSNELDNFDAPSSFLTGSITYNGESINVGRNRVRFELRQPGYALTGAIDVAIAQDGSFSSRLFDGKYKLSFVPNDGPFRTVATDTIYFDLKGNKTMDIEVDPYYMVRNAQITNSGSVINASCSLEKIITGADEKTIESARLFVNRTQFVDDTNEGKAWEATADISNLSAVTASVDISTVDNTPDKPEPDQNYLFARIGVKISGVEDLLYSEVVKINL